MSVLGVLAAGALSLVIRPVSSDIMVGEPVKLMVTWKATSLVSPVYIETCAFERGSLSFVIGTGGVEREYRELPHSVADRVLTAGELPVGRAVRNNLVLTVGESLGSVNVPFPTPGTHRLRARYLAPGGGAAPVDSNEVPISVRPLDADGLAIRTAVAGNPRLLLYGLPELRELLAQFPHHPILQAARVRILRSRFEALAMGVDPVTGQLLAAGPAAREREIDRKLRQIAQEVRNDESWGAFEEEALVTGISAAVGRDLTLHSYFRSRLRERWPMSVAVTEDQEP